MHLRYLMRALAALLICAATSAVASEHLVRVESDASVPETVQRLKEAVEAAGARVFVTVDHQAGADAAGVDLRPTTLILLGNPEIGSPALADAQTIGLEVPLRVLVYEDEAGAVWLAYGDPADFAARHGLSGDHPAIQRMQDALAGLTATAASGA